MTVDYTEDLEDKQCRLEIDFTSSGGLINSPNAVLNFQAISRTLPMIVTKDAALIGQTAAIFELLSKIALGFFAFSAVHKMIGAETLTVFQLVYLSNCLYPKTNMYFLVT